MLQSQALDLLIVGSENIFLFQRHCAQPTRTQTANSIRFLRRNYHEHGSSICQRMGVICSKGEFRKEFVTSTGRTVIPEDRADDCNCEGLEDKRNTGSLAECLLVLFVMVDCLPERMPKRKSYRSRIEILQGTLDMLILRALQWGPQHGHGIGQLLRTMSEDALQIEHGSLYPALHRLENQGWLASEWRASEANRRAKYYRLTAAGKRQLAHEQSKWQQMVETITRVMRPQEGK